MQKKETAAIMRRFPYFSYVSSPYFSYVSLYFYLSLYYFSALAFGFFFVTRSRSQVL